MRALKRIHRLSMVAAVALAGCGGKPEPEYFPLNEGYRWEYRMQETNPLVDRRLPLTMENLGLRERDGRRYFLRRSSEGNEYWLVAEHGVQRAGARSWIGGMPLPDAEPQTVLPERIELGQEWRIVTRPFILERAEPFRERFAQDESKNVELSMRIASVDDTVEVPAGRFTHCVRVEGQGRLFVLADARIGASEVPVTHTEWFAPGVGLIKLVRREDLNTTQIVGGEVSMELLRFER